MTNNHLTLSQKLLPGVFALLLLFIYYSMKSTPDTFFTWFEQTVVVYAAWFFLLRAIISMVVEREVLQEKFILPMCIGALALILDLILFKTTPESLLVDILEATVIYSVFITIYGMMKDKIHNKWYEK